MDNMCRILFLIYFLVECKINNINLSLVKRNKCNLLNLTVTKVMDTMSSKKNENSFGYLEQKNKSEPNIQYRQRLGDNSLSGAINSDHNISNSDFDIEEKSIQLTLMEKLCLLALGDERAQLSILNDNIPYVLRACILLELTLAKRTKLNLHNGGNRNEPWKLSVVINDFNPVGDVFLDEAIKTIAQENLSLQKWIDVLTGETWNRRLSEYQMRNLRERICKSLMEKGIVTSQKSSLFLVETTEYPLLNITLKRNLCHDIIDSALDPSKLNLYSLCLLLSLSGAKILHKVLKVTDAPTASRVKHFVNESLEKYSQFHNLEAKFGHLLDDDEMYLISGIFSLYNKINKFF